MLHPFDTVIHSPATYPKKTIKNVSKDLCVGMSVAVLFVIVKELKAPNCPVIGMAQEIIIYHRMECHFSIRNYAFEKYLWHRISHRVHYRCTYKKPIF